MIDLLSAHFDNCLPPCFIPLPPVLKGNALMFLFIIAFRLLKGSGLFTHFSFFASSIEHILFTLNKYLLIERRIISSFSISTDTWTFTFLRALIRQVYEGGECCLGIACSPAFECETLIRVWAGTALSSTPKTIHQGAPLPGPSLLSMHRMSDRPLSPKPAFHGYLLTVLARLDSCLEYEITIWKCLIADCPFPIFYNSPYLSRCDIH